MNEILSLIPSIEVIYNNNIDNVEIELSNGKKIKLTNFNFYDYGTIAYKSYKVQNRKERFKLYASGSRNNVDYCLLGKISTNKGFYLIAQNLFEKEYKRIIPPTNQAIWATVGNKIKLKPIQESESFICSLIEGSKTNASSSNDEDYFNETEHLGFILENGTFRNFNLYQIESIEII